MSTYVKSNGPVVVTSSSSSRTVKIEGPVVIKTNGPVVIERNPHDDLEDSGRVLLSGPLEYPWNWVLGTCLVGSFCTSMLQPIYKPRLMSFLSCAFLATAVCLLGSAILPEDQQPSSSSSSLCKQ